MDSAIIGIHTIQRVLTSFFFTAIDRTSNFQDICILVHRIFCLSNASFAFRTKCDKSFDGKHDLVAADNLRLISLSDTSYK